MADEVNQTATTQEAVVEAPTTDTTAPETVVETSTEVVKTTDTQGTETDSTASEGQVEGAPEVDANALPELDDETIGDFIEAYRDKIKSNPKLQTELDSLVRERVERQVAERVRSTETHSQVQQIIERGKTAVNNMVELASKTKKEFEKASLGQEFDSTVFTPEAFGTELQEFGAAVSTEMATRYDDALHSVIEDALKNRLHVLSDAQTQEFMTILNNAARMENDQKQAPQAKQYFVTNMFGFLLQRAMETGAAAERDRLTKKSTVDKKLVESNAVKAAAGKLATERGNLPPKSTTATPSTSKSGSYTLDDYREAMRAAQKGEAGAKARADEIAAAIASERGRPLSRV